MTKTKASLIHLLLSAVVVGAALAVVFLVWYRGPVFRISGAIDPVLVLVSVDLVIGPLLTFIVYKHGKKGLRFDMSFILVLQLVALAYGMTVLHGERPHYLVHAVDRFVVHPRKHLDEAAIPSAQLTDPTVFGLTPVFARLPTDPDEAQQFLDSVMFQGQPDLDRRPEFWEPYSAGLDIVRASAYPLTDMTPYDERDARELERVQRRFGRDNVSLAAIPVAVAEDDLAIVIDQASLEPLGLIEIYAFGDRHD